MPAFTIAAAARHCGVDRRTLQRAIQAGRLALTPEHLLTPEALAQAGYLPVAVLQAHAAGAPQGHAAPLPQELAQASALLALLEGLTTALGDLHAEVRALREDLRQTPQGRLRGAAPEPQVPPQGHAAEAPQATAPVTPLETPQEVRHTAAAPQRPPATAVPLTTSPEPPAPALDELPAHIRRIAEAREQYGRLTLRDFAQLLHDRDIYRTRDGGVVNAGTLKRWLDKAGL